MSTTTQSYGAPDGLTVQERIHRDQLRYLLKSQCNLLKEMIQMLDDTQQRRMEEIRQNIIKRLDEKREKDLDDFLKEYEREMVPSNSWRR